VVPLSKPQHGPRHCEPKLPSQQCLWASLNASVSSNPTVFLVVPDPLHVPWGYPF